MNIRFELSIQYRWSWNLILLFLFVSERSLAFCPIPPTRNSANTPSSISPLLFVQSIQTNINKAMSTRGGSSNHSGDHHHHDEEDTVRSVKATEMVRVLGICGGIGSGKSTVCQVLVSDFGCLGHIEADRLAHEVYKPNSPVLHELADAFGTDLIQEDGNLNRGALGKVVFGNPEALQRLELIVWPHVSNLVQTRIQALKDSFIDSPSLEKRPIIIVEAAVLLDAGWNEFQDGVWVVKVAPEVALQRLQEQRGMTHEEALQRIQAQESRRGMANLQDEIENGTVTSVVDNSGDLEALKQTLREKLVDKNAWYAKSADE